MLETNFVQRTLTNFYPLKSPFLPVLPGATKNNRRNTTKQEEIGPRPQLCLGVPGTAGIEALQVEAGVKPLEIRREELAVRQAARVMMKDIEECIKKSWDRFVESEKVEQLADMTSNTGISLHSLEKEFTYQECVQPSKSKPEYWNCLGSSKSRSSEQEVLSREIIDKDKDKDKEAFMSYFAT